MLKSKINAPNTLNQTLEAVLADLQNLAFLATTRVAKRPLRSMQHK